MPSKEIQEFNKAINALALELPEAVWNDFHFRWVQLQNHLFPTPGGVTKKKALKAESMPEFDESIKNMTQEQKDRVDTFLEGVTAEAIEKLWQLCPKCNGDGHLGRYNSPGFSNTTTPLCDVCNGAKILATPSTDAKSDAVAFAEWLYHNDDFRYADIKQLYQLFKQQNP